jgi:hypothetical protein
VLLSVLAAAAALTPVQVPAGDVLTTDLAGGVRIVDSRGKVVRRLHWQFAREVHSIELAANRRSAFVSLYRIERPPELFQVDLSTGRKRKLADGISPALSPDKSRLAYVTVEEPADIKYRTALVIRDLRTRALRAVPFGPGITTETPPGEVINWSPNGRTVALYDGSRIRLVDVATAVDVPSQPALSVAGSAPAFLAAKVLVILTGCCIGPQRLVTVDLRTGETKPFAALGSPVEQVRRIRSRKLLVVSALHVLSVVSRGHVRVLARRIIAAAL